MLTGELTDPSLILDVVIYYRRDFFLAVSLSHSHFHVAWTDDVERHFQFGKSANKRQRRTRRGEAGEDVDDSALDLASAAYAYVGNAW